MASIAHLAVGFALSRFLPPPRSGAARIAGAVALAALALLPDADFVGYVLGVPYGDPFGHRGATHSLVFAAACGLLAGGVGGPRVGVLATAAVASHPLLDALTDGGRGVAVLWPLSEERFFLPWRPLRVAPMGVAFFTTRGLQAALSELGIVLACGIVGCWPRSPR